MKEKFKQKLIAYTAYYLAKITNGTLRVEVRKEELIDKVKRQGKTVVFSVWHGKLWFPAYYWRDRGYVGLASESRDGEYISEILKMYGWEMVRGSSSSGGARSIIKLVRKLRQGKLVAVTPDGPTGPRHQVKSGIVYLAQKTDSTIIPVGVEFSRKKVFDSWDKFELPSPFAQASLVYGAPIQVEDKLTAKTENKYKQLIEDKMKVVGRQAEKILED